MANRLSKEESPYLLQHADNPVDWYPWGPEAFERAKSEDKPIFLSIGYSTCHWCHVMAHESFEKETVARALNRDFVSIKVDREERPDVDDVYMSAVTSMTGSGGWPLSVFLTPEGKPFYGGTYYPPEDGFGRPGFATLLGAIADAWKTRRPELETSARQLIEHLKAGAEGLAGREDVGPGLLERAARALAGQYDGRDGGFGGAPKFPPAMRLELLIRYWLRAREPLARRMVSTTLDKMAAGGMYDQVGGGFHRYSVDAQWLVPHFEKMLYDNAMLARVYLLAHRAFDEPAHARTARETLDYLLREMAPDGGGFFAAQDADSGGQEGSFYVWNPESLREAVGAEAAPVVAARFSVTARGNFEGSETVLSIVRSLPEIARDFGRSEEEISRVLEVSRRAMYEARSRRVRPGTDEKLLTDWTALAISAFSLAGRLLQEPRYEKASRQAADRILARCLRHGRLLHREGSGTATVLGFASDYANFIEALLDLYETTFEPRYFRAAVELQRKMEDTFADARGGYFFTQQTESDLILRPRETFDGATPSSNSVAAMNLLRLASFTGERKYRDRAEAIFSLFSEPLRRAPLAFPRLLSALDYRCDLSREVVLSGEPGRPDFESLHGAVFASPRMNRVVAHAGGAEAPAELAPLLESRQPRDGQALAYVCENFSCRRPTGDPAELLAALNG